MNPARHGESDAARPARESLAGRAVAALRWLRRFARGVLGSDAYDTYLHHHRVTGCTHEPLSEKEFWRARYRDQDTNPGSRCC